MAFWASLVLPLSCGSSTLDVDPGGADGGVMGPERPSDSGADSTANHGDATASGADAQVAAAECRPTCAVHPDWTPEALCEDQQAASAQAYFCAAAGGAPGTCEMRCTAAVLAAPSDRCRAAWGDYLACLAKATSYEDTVLGPDVQCDPAVLALAAACWRTQALERASKLWADKRPSSYDYRLTAQEGGGASTKWDVTVSAGVATQLPPSPPAPTLEQIFDDARAALGAAGKSVVGTYDPSLGYPRELVLVKARANGEPTWTVTKVYAIDAFIAR